MKEGRPSPIPGGSQEEEGKGGKGTDDARMRCKLGKHRSEKKDVCRKKNRERHKTKGTILFDPSFLSSLSFFL